MATATKSKPRYGTKAFYRAIGKKGAAARRRKAGKRLGASAKFGTKAYYRAIGRKGAAARRRKAGYRRVRRHFYPSFTYKKGARKGQHYRPLVVHRYSKPHTGRRRRHPSVKWSGRKGTRRYSYTTIGRGKNRTGYFTNPRRRRSSRRMRRNPTAAGVMQQYVGGLTSTPGQVGKLLTGKNAIRNGLYLAGGGVASYIAAGYVSRMVSPILERIPGLGSPMGKRITGALMPYSFSFVASRMVKDRQIKQALLLGGAAASILELFFPGRVGQWISQIPGADQIAAGESVAAGTSGLHGPVAGLNGYVSAPSYQGVAGYVSAPGYQGAGVSGADDMLAGYVSAPGYQGAGVSGADDMLAGFSDDNQPVGASSFLSDSFLTV